VSTSHGVAIFLLLLGTTSPSLVSSLPCRLWLPSSSTPPSLVHAPAVISPHRVCPLAILCLAAHSRVSYSSQLAHHLSGDMHSSCMSQIIAAASSFAGACPLQQSRRDAVTLGEAPCCPSRWIELCPSPQLAIVEYWACRRCRACRAQQEPQRHDLFQLGESSRVVVNPW
jgi:hypothetical protein